MSFIGFELGPLFNGGSILSQWCSLIASKVNIPTLQELNDKVLSLALMLKH